MKSNLPDNNELHEIQNEMGLSLKDILMSYNRLMLMLIGLFSALNLNRDGHFWIGVVIFTVCLFVANLYIHSRYHYNVYINVLEKPESVKIPLGISVVPFISEVWMDINDNEQFIKYLNQALEITEMNIKFELSEIEYSHTSYKINMKPHRSKTIFDYFNITPKDRD